MLTWFMIVCFQLNCEYIWSLSCFWFPSNIVMLKAEEIPAVLLVKRPVSAYQQQPLIFRVLRTDFKRDRQTDRLVGRPQCWQLHQHAEQYSGRTAEKRRETSNWKWQLELNSGAASFNSRSEVTRVCSSASPWGFSPNRTSSVHARDDVGSSAVTQLLWWTLPACFLFFIPCAFKNSISLSSSPGGI